MIKKGVKSRFLLSCSAFVAFSDGKVKLEKKPKYTRLSVCLSVHLTVCLSACKSTCLFFCLSVFLSIPLSGWPAVFLSVCSYCMSVYLSVHLFICLSICVYLFVCVCLSSYGLLISPRRAPLYRAFFKFNLQRSI